LEKVQERPAPAGQRKFTGSMRLFIAIISVVMALYHILWITGTFLRLNISMLMLSLPHYAISLGFVLFLLFLLFPAKRGKVEPKVPWYDILFSILGLVCCWYIAFFYESHVLPHGLDLMPSMLEKALFIILLPLLFEAGRRTIGIVLPIFAMLFFFYPMGAEHFPGVLFGHSFDFKFMTLNLYMGEDGLWSIPMRVASTIIIAFLLFAGFLLVSGAGRTFIKIALSLAGRVRGGAAKVAIVGSGLFGTISGAATANVATTGMITIPLMKEVGYKPAFAGAVEAVASNGGQLMPPIMGVVSFIMAEMTGIPYVKVCLYALLPAILYYIAVFVQVDLEGTKSGMKSLPREMLPPFWETIKEGWHYLLPIAAFLYFLIFEGYNPEMAAIYSMGVLIIVSWFRRKSRITLRQILYSLEYGARALLLVTPACALVGILIGSVSVTGIAPKITSTLVTLSGNSLVLLAFISAGASFLMGMGLGSIAIYVSLSIMVAPALVEMGVPVIAAHLFIYYWGLTAFITPPVCVAAYVAAGIAQAPPMRTGWYSMRLGIATYMVPFLFLFNPVLVLQGELPRILLASVTAIIGISLLAAAISGYMLRILHLWERILLLIASLMIMWPGWMSDVIGILLAAALLAPQIRTWWIVERTPKPL
jgi:TRAP transporter 4TM/12TM fusion protein